MNTKTTSPIGLAIIGFLQREDAKSTFWYERWPILLVEALCLIAGMLAAPNQAAAILLMIDAPRALFHTELARATRSGAARKAELAKALKVPEVELACQRDIEAAARNHQLMVAAVPLVTLAMSVAASGGAGLSRAAVVGFVTSVVRYAMVEGYGYWRNWYRQQVPVKLKVTIPVTVLLSPEEQYEAWRPSEGQLSKVIGEAIEQYEHPRIVARAVDDFLRDCIDSYTQKGKAMSGLAALSRSQPVIREHGGAVAEENVSAGDMSGVVQFRLDDQLRNASQDTRSEATKAFADAWRDRFKASADEGMQRKDSPSINMGEPIGHAEEITHDGTDLVLRVSGQKNRSDAKRLAETTPFQSEAIAKAAEDVLRAKSTDEEYER